MKKKKEEEEYEEEKERKIMNTLRFSMISGGFKLRVVEQVMWPCSVLVHCIQVYANFRIKVSCLHFTQSQNIPSWPMQSTTLTGAGATANFSNAHVFHRKAPGGRGKPCTILSIQSLPCSLPFPNWLI